MKKSNIRCGILAVLLLIIYNLLVFVIPFVHNGVFWLSYGFTLDAFVIAGAACVIAFRSGRDLDSKFFGYPVAKVGIIYLVVQLILSFVFMALATHVPIWLGVLVYAIALAVAVIGLVVKDTVRDHILSQDINLRNEVTVIRSAQAKLNQLISLCNDPEAAVAVKKLAEEVRYSDPVSSPELTEIEADLTADINELQNALVEEDFAAVLSLCKHAQMTVLERNRLCKLNKKKS
jgi:hypothetical protein